jgi:hypothetical protein
MMIVHKENLVDRKESNICVPIYIYIYIYEKF